MGRVERLQRPDGNSVAYAKTAGTSPTVVFLGGFRSDMTGTKAVALEDWAQRTGRAFLRFDYLGHGQSSGRFEDGTIGRWLDDSLAAIDAARDLIGYVPSVLIAEGLKRTFNALRG